MLLGAIIFVSVVSIRIVRDMYKEKTKHKFVTVSRNN